MTQYGDQRGSLQGAQRSLIELGRWADQRGWCPATGGNFSLRLRGAEGDERCLITASGVHKGELTSSDFIELDLEGRPLNPQDPNRPSAETLIHLELYKLSADTGAVLHTHSVLNTVLSRATEGERLSLEGWEMQKALRAQTTHEAEVGLAIFDNSQDMRALAAALRRRWEQRADVHWGFLVRGHGLYSWGRDLAEARRHLEAIEFLLACHLELLRLSGHSKAALTAPTR